MSLRIQHKILGIAILPPLLVAIPILSTVGSLGNDLKEDADEEMTVMLEGLLSKIVEKTDAVCRASHESTLAKVRSDLEYLKREVTEGGGLTVDASSYPAWWSVISGSGSIVTSRKRHRSWIASARESGLPSRSSSA